MPQGGDIAAKPPKMLMIGHCHLAALRKVFAELDVFVSTLGLTET